MLPFIVIHLVLDGLLLWAAFNKRPWLHIPAVWLLASEAVGYLVAPNIRTDDFIFSDAEFMWWLYGPIFIPIMLTQAAEQAPLWVVPSLSVGLLVGAGAWLVLWRWRKRRIWAPISVLAFVLATWVTAETVVEITMRTGAQRIAGACDIRRRSAPEMFVNGLSWPANHRHGSMKDGVGSYDWQFSAGGWVYAGRCPAPLPGAPSINYCACSAGG